MSNQSLTFSYKSLVSVTHEQNIICSKTLICRSRGGISANEKEGRNASNDNTNTPDQGSRRCDNRIYIPVLIRSAVRDVAVAFA